MSKFGSLSAPPAASFRVNLVDQNTNLPLRDHSGAQAYIDVQFVQSDNGRAIDRQRQRQVAARMMMQGGADEDTDQLQQNADKLAALTTGWHLVDPVSKEPLDVPYSAEAAAEFYKLPLAYPFYLQVWLAANLATNFMRGASAPS